MRFCVLNLGCKVNRVESDQISSIMQRNAVESDISGADIVVVNTCTVTGEAEKKTRKTIRHVLRNNDSCEVIVTGCASEISPAFFSELSDRVHVVAKRDVVDHVSKLVCGSGEEGESAYRYGASFHTRVGIKIQDGCDNACTYCIVHVARGEAVSETPERIIDECEAYALQGVKEMVLTGINLGSYRRSTGTRSYMLHDLLEELLERTEPISDDGMPCRFRLSSIEPNDLAPHVIDLLARSDGRLCRHLHLPMQSGSSKVLHEMARRYDAGSYLDLIRDIRRAVPQISLSTDVIVGFPGETESDFDQTLRLARECGFSKIHVFPYSKREGTPAASRSDQVPDDVKAERARVLRCLSDELRRADCASRAGTIERAVVERNGVCMSESYYELSCSSDLPVGKMIQIEMPSACTSEQSA